MKHSPFSIFHFPFAENIPLQLIFTVCLSLLMLFLLPYAPAMAVHPASTPLLYGAMHCTALLTHILYIFAHASILHCIINTWCLLCLSAVITPLRFSLALFFAIAISFTPLVTAPTVGFSVILFFFYGYLARLMYARRALGLVFLIAFLALGLFLPWIAAGLHIAMFLLGILSWHIEGFVRTIIAQATP